MDDPTKLLWIERAMNISALLVAIGVSGEFIGNWIAGPIRKRLDTAKEAEIARLNKEAGNARKEAGEAVERAAKTEKQAAELNKKAEEERLARLRIEEHFSPRRISEKQAEELIAALAPMKGKNLSVLIIPGDAETSSFADRILAILKASGINVSPAIGMMSVTEPGLAFTVGTDRAGDLDIIGHALVKVALAKPPIHVSKTENKPNDLTLVVGPKN